MDEPTYQRYWSGVARIRTNLVRRLLGLSSDERAADAGIGFLPGSVEDKSRSLLGNGRPGKREGDAEAMEAAVS